MAVIEASSVRKVKRTSSPHDNAIDHSKVRVDVQQVALFDASSRSVVALGVWISLVWLLIGTIFGDISSFKFDMPDWLAQQDWLTFGRVRPAHLNAMVYGWASTAMFSVSLWLIPRLCRTPLQWRNLAMIGILWWNMGVAIGIVALLRGYGDGLEWLELDNVIADPLLIIGAGMVGASIWKTLASRKVEHMFVSVWYITASYPWFVIIFTAGNLPIYQGVESAAVNWFYAHNALGLWLTTVNLGLIYYIIPKVIGRPVYSYWLSLIGFWGLALFYALNGMHHLIGGPMPSWMIATSITASILMVIPVVAVGINHHMTVAGRFGALRYSPALTLIVLAAMSYTAVSLQGILTALVGVNRITHFTHWTIAHSHLGLYMFVTLSLFGGLYYILPKLWNQEWPSAGLIRAHIGFIIAGMVLYVVALGFGGVLQGLSLLDPAQSFQASVEAARPWMHARSVAAVLITLGHLAFVWHVILLYRLSRRHDQVLEPAFYYIRPILVKEE